MSSPLIQYAAPQVSTDPDNLRHHIQLIYQKLGNHTQAFTLVQQAITNLKTASTTTTTPAPSGGSSVPISLGGVNNQTGNTSYTTTPGDDGAVILFNDASAVAVTLSSSVNPFFYTTITNFGSGTVTLTPATGTINGTSSFTVPTDGLTIVVFDGNNFWATAVQAVPTGLSVTITTAKLTTGGTNGSQTFTNGILTASTPAT